MLITEFKEGIRYIYQNETLKITFGIYRVWLIIFVTCLFQAILLSGKKRIQGVVKEVYFSEYSF